MRTSQINFLCQNICVFHFINIFSHCELCSLYYIFCAHPFGLCVCVCVCPSEKLLEVSGWLSNARPHSDLLLTVFLCSYIFMWLKYPWCFYFTQEQAGTFWTLFGILDFIEQFGLYLAFCHWVHVSCSVMVLRVTVWILYESGVYHWVIILCLFLVFTFNARYSK